MALDLKMVIHQSVEFFYNRNRATDANDADVLTLEDSIKNGFSFTSQPLIIDTTDDIDVKTYSWVQDSTEAIGPTTINATKFVIVHNTGYSDQLMKHKTTDELLMSFYGSSGWDVQITPGSSQILYEPGTSIDDLQNMQFDTLNGGDIFVKAWLF